jgi:hypothetical protein
MSFAAVISIAVAAITVFAAAASSCSASDRRPHPVNVQAMDLLSEGTASVMDDKIQTVDDLEGNDGNKQR